MIFDPRSLRQILNSHPLPARYIIGYSGGLDSTCLLHALAELCAHQSHTELLAVHIHHGLSTHADRWAEHCRQQCLALGVAYQQIMVDATAGSGESPEAVARDARYRALGDIVGEGDILLTAHHQDDQAETLLIQLIRGSGVDGISAMPSFAPFFRGHLLRPLLGVTREALHNYALEQCLHWIDDESNNNLRFSRNYLRHQVMPVLRQRWPAVSATLSRTAAHCAEAGGLLGELAMQDMGNCMGDQPRTLRVSALMGISAARQRNLIRYWVQHHGMSTPDSRHLTRIERDLLHCATDAKPVVCWAGVELRRYRDLIYLMPALVEHDSRQVIEWMPHAPLYLPSLSVTLVAQPVVGQGLRIADEPLSVRFRCGGERCQPVGRQHHHDLKKLFQALAIPPWRRDRIPLIYIDNRLAAVVGYWVCEPFQAKNDEPGLLVTPASTEQ